jgi:hypothetical protein
MLLHFIITFFVRHFRSFDNHIEGTISQGVRQSALRQSRYVSLAKLISEIDFQG